MSKQGTLYGLSLGPGNPDLITRRSWALLQSDAIWAYPVRKKGSVSYALDIAKRAEHSVPHTAIELIFPMTHNREILAKYWLQAAQTVLEQLNRGADVCFLVEGDASTYSTFTHLARTLKALDEKAAIEVVPGVSAYHAAAAHLNIPLADTDDTVAIVPAAYGIETLDSLIDQFDTLVLIKVKPLLDEIIDLLDKRGIISEARFVEKVGSPDERTVSDISTLRNQKVNYLSLMLVRNPNRSRGKLIRGCRKKP